MICSLFKSYWALGKMFNCKCLFVKYRKSVAYIAKVTSRCLHYFPAATLVHIWCAATWRFHTEFRKFLGNISTNICGLGKRTDLNLGEASSSFISNRVTISWLYSLNGFRFTFFTAREWKQSIPSSWPPKIVNYKFSAKFRCCLFVTSTCPDVPASPSPAFPHSRVPPSPRPTSQCPRIPSPTSPSHF